MSTESADFELSGHHRPLEYHRMLLEDGVRVAAYQRALAASVEEGDVVLDLGTGTGILALMAARLGARVHAVESSAVAGLTRQVVADNQLDDLITVHHADIRTMDVIEPVDIVVSDFMGRTIVDDGMLSAVRAGARWLKDEGRFIPSRVWLRAAPVGDLSMRPIDFFTGQAHGFDFSAALPYALNYCYSAALPAESVLAEPLSVAEVVPGREAPTFEFEVAFSSVREARLQALALWFRAEMVPGVVLDTGPGRQTHWGQYLLPVPPTDIAGGDMLRASVRLGPASEPSGTTLTGVESDAAWFWQGEIECQDREPLAFDLSSEQKLGRR